MRFVLRSMLVVVITLGMVAVAKGLTTSSGDYLSGVRLTEEEQERAQKRESKYLPKGEVTYSPLFVGWPKPEVTLFISGRQKGYIEPCGCTGLANQKGGLSRRFTFYNELKEKGWDPLAIDVGNQVKRVGRQADIKSQMTFEALRKMDYAAIAFGPNDLTSSIGEILALAAEENNNLVSADLDLFELVPQYRIVTSGGKKIGITAILGEQYHDALQYDEIVKTDPQKAIDRVLPKLLAEKCDQLVLLAHTTVEDSKKLARANPQFSIIVNAGGHGEPSHLAEIVEGTNTRLVQVGAKGMYVGVVGIFDDEREPIRFQKVPLDARFVDSPEMLANLKDYQNQLQQLGLEGLGIKPLPHPSGRKFIGSEACGDCHVTEYDIWSKTPHSHALDSLVNPGERSEIPRHFDPECLSCHVTGWDPQGYFPYESGYLSLGESPDLFQNGCENCHGPGDLHVAMELGEIEATDEELFAIRAEMVVGISEARQTCLSCHDLDNSPDFHKPNAFEAYWEKIKHGKGTQPEAQSR
ncbi:MAG: hypothetical protein MPJ24_08835 [Pirellulaceae bacterium]|nr:hypothetical protein [Pirellulaceae bacterium]